MFDNSWLCTGTFNNDMLKSFVGFYTKIEDKKLNHAVIFIDSPGGYVHVLNSMLSIMENSQINWHTVVIGTAASCGLLLAAGGHFRYATDRAEFMFHDVSAGTHGKVDEMEEDVARIKRLSNSVMTKFSKRTNHPKKWWLEQADNTKNRELWFDCKKAVSFGVTDYIGIPSMLPGIDIQVTNSKR
jgi:ATP-dependent protease ClpP protease subunit